jgi:riboflavin synthase
VSLIPYTVAQTTLREKAVGQRVNVEPDLLAKYAERLLAGSAPGRPVTEETLRQNGFME